MSTDDGRPDAAVAELPVGLSGTVLDPEVLRRMAAEMMASLSGPNPTSAHADPTTRSAPGISPPPAWPSMNPSTFVPPGVASPHASLPISVGGAGLSPGALTPSEPTIASSHGSPAPVPAPPGGARAAPASLFLPIGAAQLPTGDPLELASRAASELIRATHDLGSPVSTAGAGVPLPPAAATDASPGNGSLYFLDHSIAEPVREHVFTPGVSPDESARSVFDVESVRRDFPILEERVHGKRLIWLDNAATTQKPRAVIDRLAEFYERENSNIHRAAHTLAARATDAYEGAREKVRRFLGASSSREIVFTRGTTESVNLVAQSWGKRHVKAGDEVLVSWLEHHSNIVPWQLLCAEVGARLCVAPIDDDGQIRLDEFEKLLGPKTRIVAVSHVSNALGTITPVRQMIEMAHRHGARVLVDGAQSVAHMPVDVRALDADFYVFSGHKLFGPTGIGVVYGKEEVLAHTPPWQGGGNMITDVTFEKTVYAPPPARFEAGTGNIADAVGLGAAIDYLERLGMHNVERYEHELMAYATAALRSVPGLRPIGTAKEKAGVLSFVLDGFRSEEVGAALDRDGIAVRSGHHCAQPALRRFGLETTVRPSLALYNTRGDVDALVESLLHLQRSRGHRA